MKLPPLPPGRASEIINRFKGVPILVVGDVMLDRFIVGRVTRISPEAPVPVLQFASEYVRLGGAANVAHNVTTLGGTAAIVGLVGDDQSAATLRAELGAAGIDAAGLVADPARRTTEKVRLVTERNQQVARIDYEDERDASGEIERAVASAAARIAAQVKAILVSDYLKGTVTRNVITSLLPLTQRSVPVIVDPKIPHLSSYAGATKSLVGTASGCSFRSSCRLIPLRSMKRWISS